MSAFSPSKSERIDVRATLAVKQLLQQAAACSHKNVSEFLLDAGILAANQALADRRRFELGEPEWQAFNALLDRPVSAPAAKVRLRSLLSEPSILE